MISDRNACIVLNMISGIGYARYAALVRRFGSPAMVLSATEQEIAEVKGIGSMLAQAVSAWRSTVDLQGELETAARCGIDIYTIEESDYPEKLRQLADPPLVIYARGKLPDFSTNSVAIVGSRRLSAYGSRMAAHFASDAVMANWKVISGLAFGVDAVAHRTTLERGGVTVAVLGGGGSDDVALAHMAGADTYVSGELKYHQLCDAPEAGMNLIEAGHFYTEQPVCSALRQMLLAIDPAVTCDLFFCDRIQTI